VSAWHTDPFFLVDASLSLFNAFYLKPNQSGFATACETWQECLRPVFRAKRATKITKRTLTIAPAGIMGDLSMPATPKGTVIFAHGSGSSRFSVRNRYVAGELEPQFATLLLDLLTPEEDQTDLRTREFRFDIHLLAQRLEHATRWIARELADLPVGYFGASTGAAAALVAAAALGPTIQAIVSRGGRPDLAGAALPMVKAPTLLVVGGNDTPIIPLSQKALDEMTTTKELVIVPAATHLFEEPGALEQVASLARGWFERYLGNEGTKPAMGEEQTKKARVT
jgi:pimeloyl-ACP methyl ester carboxylesterase